MTDRPSGKPAEEGTAGPASEEPATPKTPAEPAEIEPPGGVPPASEPEGEVSGGSPVPESNTPKLPATDKTGSKEFSEDSTEESEIERLRRENEAMRAALAKEPGKTRIRQGGAGRGFLSVLLIVLACLFSLFGVLSAWVRTTTLNTNSFVGTVAPLIRNEQIVKVTTDAAIDELFTQYQVEQEIEKGLNELTGLISGSADDSSMPDLNLSFIAGPITSGLKDIAGRAARGIIETDAFYGLWEKALRTAHSTMVDIVRGREGALVTSRHNTVVLDLGVLVNDLKDELANAGLGFLKNVSVPEGLGQIELFSAEELGSVKSLVRLLDLLSWVLPLMALICFIGGVLAANSRRRGLMGAGIGLGITMLLLLVVLRIVHWQLFGVIEDREIIAAADVVWGSVLKGLNQAVWGLLFFGVVVAAGAAISGPYSWARWLRTSATDLLTNLRERRGKDVESRGRVSVFVDRYRKWFWAGGLVVAIIVLLLLPSFTVLAIFLVLLVFAVYLAAVELLR